MALVPIIMGSRSDLEHAKKVAAALAELGIRSELRVASAHKSAAHVLALVAAYEADPEPKVYICIAGRSNALAGMVDANVTWPVVTCPVYSDRFGGADIFSSLRMPSGVVPALVLEPQGAALLVAKIFAHGDASLRGRIAALQRKYTERIISDDADLRAAEEG